MSWNRPSSAVSLEGGHVLAQHACWPTGAPAPRAPRSRRLTRRSCRCWFLPRRAAGRSCYPSSATRAGPGWQRTTGRRPAGPGAPACARPGEMSKPLLFVQTFLAMRTPSDVPGCISCGHHSVSTGTRLRRRGCGRMQNRRNKERQRLSGEQLSQGSSVASARLFLAHSYAESCVYNYRFISILQTAVGLSRGQPHRVTSIAAKEFPPPTPK